MSENGGKCLSKPKMTSPIQRYSVYCHKKVKKPETSHMYAAEYSQCIPKSTQANKLIIKIADN